MFVIERRGVFYHRQTKVWGPLLYGEWFPTWDEAVEAAQEAGLDPHDCWTIKFITTVDCPR